MSVAGNPPVSHTSGSDWFLTMDAIMCNQTWTLPGSEPLGSGVESEPFEVGDDLIEASGKLHLLDKMLDFLHSRISKKINIDSIEIPQIKQGNARPIISVDNREGYSYEHVDGSMRGEERHLAIKNFGQQPNFIFLLNTRAGGIGMNITAADTVIFVDCDFNPQNDLQAAARVHQIGHNK
ncbi:Chromodomain-helicase-DNA-binding protein 1-like [Sciurus carolinensis]|uniref:Chromodomain-helicase-DNA-binding protein 1-like n=1 Tax=Sciurus carolinensis TaxID=30640 RepID=A0AA41NFF6_SCICA|nr:Chromodomain-helicase-DNA-binding protein 1-like [Sciurus carolinensis]